MPKFFLLFTLFICNTICVAQVKVILDTDPSFDPDDAGCMAMLHTMANQGECEILAMINSTNQKESAVSISAINYFYNRPAIAVGDYKGYAQKITADNTYDAYLAKNYPSGINSWEEALDGVKLYREILASAADTSITVVIIGTMHNFYGLLKSDADEFSVHPGKELVAQKVKQVVTMGGNFINGKGYDRTNWGGADQLCSYTDWSCLNEERNRMCRYVIDECPAPFIASGWEVGCGDYYNANYGNVITGQGLKQLDTNHIIRRSYEVHFMRFSDGRDISRHSNDQCALHYAIRGSGENYQAFTKGTIELSTSGVCSWTPLEQGNQGYIQKVRHKDSIAAEIEELMMGNVSPPDLTAPSPPAKLWVSQQASGSKLLQWTAAEDPTPSSWISGYNIYFNDKLLKTAYGLKYILPPDVDVKLIKVKAFNTYGLESAAKTHD